VPGVDALKRRLREFKPFWAVYNLANYRRLRGNAARYRQLGIKKSVVAPVSHRDIERPSGEVPWLDRPAAEEALAGSAELATFPESVRAQLERWPRDGFMVLKRYFSPERVDAINADLERLLDDGTIKYHFRGERIMNSFRSSEPVRSAVHDQELQRLLGFVLGREVTLFQTINFFRGSQQHPHSDSFHMTTEPMGYLVGIWVALEDISSDSGPVVYYPGSHRLPYVMTEDFEQESNSLFLSADKDRHYVRKMDEVVEQAGIEPVEFTAGKGDVLVWHANLIHGGRPIGREGATRKSLVAHYFGKGVLCYHEVTERPAMVATQ
jgi:ectoine hydroxylase